MTAIGFIGTGIMGRPMAGHLQTAGHELFIVKHESEPPAQLTDRGAVICDSCRQIAERADVIITMVPDTPDVADVLFGPDGVAEASIHGKTIVDMSTVSPIETIEFARRINDLGGDYLDAPVSGGDVGAQNATLTIMVGGSTKTFERIRPLFELMGQNVTHVGENGAGQTCKAANQIIVAMTIQAVSEALLFASKAGVDPARVREALMGGFASSRILEVHGERMIQRAFDPGFRVGLHKKDLNLTLSGARELGVSLPGTALAQELFNACDGNGWAELDHSAMIRVLEKMADHELASRSRSS
jgi:2-hydroxy-3-oxopropionate reductase